MENPNNPEETDTTNQTPEIVNLEVAMKAAGARKIVEKGQKLTFLERGRN